MTKSTIRQIFDEKFQQMKLHYDRMRNIKSEENIRHFRVGVKRLRAFLRLLSAESGKKIPLPDDLRKVYKYAGAAHDLQMDQQRIKKQIGAGDYSLDRKLAAVIKQLDTLMKPFLLRQAREKLKKQLPAKLSAKSIEDFFYSNLAIISDVAGGNAVTDIGLHTARKRMKDLLYDGKLLDDKHPGLVKLPGWNYRKEKEYTKLSLALGDYRDEAAQLQQEAFVDKSKLLKKHVAARNELTRSLEKFIARNRPDSS